MESPTLLTEHNDAIVPTLQNPPVPLKRQGWVGRVADNWHNEPMKGIKCGLGLIIGGIICLVIMELYHHQMHWTVWVIITIVGHAFLIFGEIITAIYFLHHKIEKRNLDHNTLILKESTAQATLYMYGVVDKMMVNVQAKADILTENIKKDLFKALLLEKNIMPYDIIDYIEDAGYITKLIRKDFTERYAFVGEDEENHCITFEVEMEFYLHNVSEIGDEPMEYDMQLEFTNTPQVTYHFRDARFAYDTITHPRNLKIGDFKRLRGDDYPETSPNSGIRRLKDSIKLYPGERVKINQKFNTCFHTENNTLISDVYYSHFYTIGVHVIIEDLPTDKYSFKVYNVAKKADDRNGTIVDNDGIEVQSPLAKDSNLNQGEAMNQPELDKTEDIRRDIEFLLPGQGYFIELRKK